MIYALLILSGIANIVMAIAIWNKTRQFKAVAWKNEIVRTSMFNRLVEGVGSPQSAKNFKALQNGEWV